MHTTVLSSVPRRGVLAATLILLAALPGCGPSNAVDKQISANNLKQLAMGMLNYRDSMMWLPPVTGKVQGQAEGMPWQPGMVPAGLSWRFHVLPYIEQDNLYKLALFTKPPNEAEPWNRSDLLGVPVRTFMSPVAGQTDPTKTYYRVFVGGGALFSGSENDPGVLRADTAANTIMIVEAGEAVPWTKPEELAYDPDKPLPPLGGLFADGFHAAFADGSVRFIPRTTDEKTIRAMITGKKAN
jgi:hypothetical protein